LQVNFFSTSHTKFLTHLHLQSDRVSTIHYDETLIGKRSDTRLSWWLLQEHGASHTSGLVLGRSEYRECRQRSHGQRLTPAPWCWRPGGLEMAFHRRRHHYTFRSSGDMV